MLHGRKFYTYNADSYELVCHHMSVAHHYYSII